jgi:DNA helicase HerA-like ATPase
MRSSERTLLYQVARLRLADAAWAGSQALLPHATAHLVGWPDGTWIRSLTHLPRPHEPIFRAGELAGALAASFYPIGKVKGTEIPVGLRVDAERRGHIAILGMSGMGKTAVAQRICSTLGSDHVVVALDTTGEYVSRLSFRTWPQDDFETLGHFVYEPAGDPPDRAASFIEQCMRAGAAEYQSGGTPTRRVVLLEEAHTFLPEWNVALRAQQERVAFSTRMIMQARKFGLTFVMVSQRTAVVSKSALSQCENYIILKTLDQTGLEYLESLVGPEMRDAIPSLERYEAMCVGPAFNSDAPVIISLDPP